MTVQKQASIKQVVNVFTNTKKQPLVGVSAKTELVNGDIRVMPKATLSDDKGASYITLYYAPIKGEYNNIRDANTVVASQDIGPYTEQPNYEESPRNDSELTLGKFLVQEMPLSFYLRNEDINDLFIDKFTIGGYKFTKVTIQASYAFAIPEIDRDLITLKVELLFKEKAKDASSFYAGYVSRSVGLNAQDPDKKLAPSLLLRILRQVADGLTGKFIQGVGANGSSLSTGLYAMTTPINAHLNQSATGTREVLVFNNGSADIQTYADQFKYGFITRQLDGNYLITIYTKGGGALLISMGN